MRLYYRENPKNYINEQNEGRERCAICLEDFEIEEVLVTPCNHIFHEECIIPWVKSHDQCPVCRFAGLQQVMEGETEVFFLKQLEVTIPLFFLYELILFNPTNEHANHKQQWMYQHSPK